MPFDWKNCIAIAGFIENNAKEFPCEEAALRCAVSRAYFGAYCHARDYAQRNLGYPPKKDAGDHGALAAYFSNHKDYGITAKLKRLRQWRNACDYEATVDVEGWDLSTMAVEAVKRAEAIAEALR